ncbi:alkaline phosphatase [Desulfobotulus sp. H1]|uniref:Alkaline phosphatase n=1 Tax=Desulfobotulus pelophilus TaxID=2823377 RepID=A0ABT3N7T4_9BACT|nr:alkaline phosphatase [Desulfobotulus pelophilus]MCW7753517.1 alkaline phosphatase [Desulfobotulus pelophilus]
MLNHMRLLLQAMAFCAVMLLASHAMAAKNVVLMISDGMGFGTVMATDYYYGDKPVYASFPEKYFMTTHSAIGDYRPEAGWKVFGAHKLNPTDSAAASTAMATGVKTIPGMIGRNSAGTSIKNIVETAAGQGMTTGLVTSVPISHATPAGMVAHVLSRNQYEDIAQEMLYASDLDVLMGAGHPLYDNNGNLKISGQEYKYVGGEGVFHQLMSEEGLSGKDGRIWHFMDDKADFEALARGDRVHAKVLGLARAATTLQQARPGNRQIVDRSSPNPETPTLAVMSLGALNALSANGKNFFLMVEGGAVDWAAHSNEKGRLIEEQRDFNEAVAAVTDWVENHSSWEETLLIVTSDHECGYLWGSESRRFTPVQDRGAGNMPEMAFHSDGHSNLPVPLYVKGEGVSGLLKSFVDGRDSYLAGLIAAFDPDFTGEYIDNTDLFLFMNQWISEEKGSHGKGLWLKGDLHAHSLYSDGNAPLAAVIREAEARGFDFFSLTDHDSYLFDRGIYEDIFPAHWEDRDHVSRSMQLLYGVEWTSARGHANVWAAAPFDYGPLWQANDELNATAALYGAHRGQALFSINHPAAVFCCPWKYDVDHLVDTVEVWNSMYRFPNFNVWASHPFWDAQLIQGRRLTAVGGSDTHKLSAYASGLAAKVEASLFGLGNPTTWVYAEERSPEAILAAIRKGHVTLSHAPDKERLELLADRDGDGYFETIMGDNIVRTDTAPVTFRLQVHNPESAGRFAKPAVEELDVDRLMALVSGETDWKTLALRLQKKGSYLACILKNGILHRAWILSGGASEVLFTDTPSGRGRTYYRAQLLGSPENRLAERLLHGRVTAITNPIYINFPVR